jgi:hypothetical protein
MHTIAPLHLKHTCAFSLLRFPPIKTKNGCKQNSGISRIKVHSTLKLTLTKGEKGANLGASVRIQEERGENRSACP